MVDYVKLQNTAQRLIGQFGTDWTHRRIVKGTYNPSTNVRTTTSTTDTTVKAARLNYKKSQVIGEVIKQGDIKLVVEAKAFSSPPTVDDEMISGSETWQIVDIIESKPATTSIYYEMQLRK